MNLYLIRHGQTDWNVAGKIQGSTDIPLNDMGKRQAGCLAKGMESRPVTKVYTSKLKRAYETGYAIAESQKVPVEQIPGLEEVGYGVWEGLTTNEIAEKYPKELEQWYLSPVDVAPPQGESQTEVYERCGKAIDRIMAEAKGDVAIVSHGATVVFLLEYLLRGNRREDEEDIIVGNASISTIEYNPETREFRLAQLNDRSHLKGLE
ncbi:MAG: histidine phosphatase family protein [Hungatella sp.]|nr:histidine phosphatase family protein [Hungatella sp.]